MQLISLFSSLAGLGIFLFALRFLTNSLDESVSSRVSPSLDKINRGIFRPFLSGLGLTFVFQASSITLITSMGLLSRRLLSLESAILMMLGATVGTTLKSWFFAYNINGIGPLLIIFTSVGLLFSRRHLKRRVFEIFFSIGLMFIGWEMLGAGLKPILNQPEVVHYVEGLKDTTFSGLLLAMLCGVFLASLVQSSSTVMFLTLSLAASEKIPFLVGVGVVLGANIGTTTTALLASLEYNKDVKRLALSHFIVKAVGAFMSILLFKTFLNSIDALFFGALDKFDLASKLAAVHMGFNIINSIIWIILMPFLVKLVHRLIPDSMERKSASLSKPVIHMLTQIPDQAMIEIKKGFAEIVRSVKTYEDSVFSKLGLNENDSNGLDVEQIKGEFTAHEKLLIGVGMNNEDYREQVARRLRKLANLKLVFEELLVINNMISKTSAQKLGIVSRTISQHGDIFNQELCKIWLMVLKEDESLEEIAFESVFRELENLINIAYDKERVEGSEDLHAIYSYGVMISAYFQRLAPFAMGKRSVLVQRSPDYQIPTETSLTN